MRAAGLVVALGCVFLVVGVGLAIFRFGDGIDCSDKPDWDAWRETAYDDSGSSPERGEDRRRDATRHFMQCRSLHGRHRREVRRLLGKPAETSPAVRGTHTFESYYLGPDGLGIDSEWLDIEYDGHGRVVRLDVAQT
jgi:hypothetical protein